MRPAVRPVPVWVVCASLGAVCAASAVAHEQADRRIAEAAVREARALIERDLFGRYDVVTLEVLRREENRLAPGPDYGLVRVTLRFAATRNETRTASLSRTVFEPSPASRR